MKKGCKHDVEAISLLSGQLAALTWKIDSLKLGNDSSHMSVNAMASASIYNDLTCVMLVGYLGTTLKSVLHSYLLM